MGNRKIPKLQKIDTNRPVTAETDSVFLHCLYTSLLLALKERGLLNEKQYCHAEENLKQWQ